MTDTDIGEQIAAAEICRTRLAVLVAGSPRHGADGVVNVSCVLVVSRDLIESARAAARAEEMDPRTKTGEREPGSESGRVAAARMRIDSLMREIESEVGGMPEPHRGAVIGRARDRLQALAWEGGAS